MNWQPKPLCTRCKASMRCIRIPSRRSLSVKFSASSLTFQALLRTLDPDYTAAAWILFDTERPPLLVTISRYMMFTNQIIVSNGRRLRTNLETYDRFVITSLSASPRSLTRRLSRSSTELDGPFGERNFLPTPEVTETPFLSRRSSALMEYCIGNA